MEKRMDRRQVRRRTAGQDRMRISLDKSRGGTLQKRNARQDRRRTAGQEDGQEIGQEEDQWTRQDINNNNNISNKFI